jgi:integration host factor subunit alpha
MSDNNLTRIEIANFINKEVGISRSESSYFVDTIVNEMIKALIEKKILKVSSFGTLKLRYKKERIGRNPKTGTEHTISARNTVSFIASKVLKNKVNS